MTCSWTRPCLDTPGLLLADECAGTFSQEVASVQLKLNMCHFTNQSYDDEDEEPDKTRDADPTNDPWNKLLLQSAARPLKKRVHSHMEIEDLPKCPTMAIEDAPSVDGQKPGAASSMDVPANASKDATAVAATPPMVPCVPLGARANAEMPMMASQSQSVSRRHLLRGISQSRSGLPCFGK